MLSEALGEVDCQQQTADLDGKKRKFNDLIFSQELDIHHYTELRYPTQKSWNC